MSIEAVRKHLEKFGLDKRIREYKISFIFIGNTFLCKKINDITKAIKNLKLIICNSVE